METEFGASIVQHVNSFPEPMISRRRRLTMTITITAFERSPDGGKDWRVIRAFAGRWKKWRHGRG
jgi:hypothetical protein